MWTERGTQGLTGGEGSGLQVKAEAAAPLPRVSGRALGWLCSLPQARGQH